MKIKTISASVLVTFALAAAPVFAFERFPRVQNASDPARTRVCEARQDIVKKRMSTIDKFAANREEKFSSIAQRVENYYTTKVVPGKSVANYDSLVADIADKKKAVDAALVTAENEMGSFSCDVDHPRETVLKFRVDIQEVKKALENYRHSIRNLIVAVRSVTGTTEKAENASPKPSTNPGAGDE